MVGKPQFTPTFSFGNVAQIGITVAAMAVAWGNFQTKVSNNAEQVHTVIQAIEDASDEAQRDKEALGARIRYLEAQSARTDERYNLILQMISEMKTQVNELTKMQISR